MPPRAHIGSFEVEKGVHLLSAGSKGGELECCLEKVSEGKAIHAREKAQGWNL